MVGNSDIYDMGDEISFSMTGWIETAGSPFVIMEQEYAPLYDAEKSYSTICNIDGYVGTVEIDGHKIVVLGDEPMPVRVIRKGYETIIIRWRYAPGTSEVESIVDNIDLGTLSEISHEMIDFDSKDLVMFDAALYLEEDSNAVQLQPLHKAVNIVTYEYNTDRVSLIIHKLKS